MNQPDPFSIAVCPRCLSRLRVKQASLGKTIGCTNCDHRFVAQASLGLGDESSGDYTAPPVSNPRTEERLEIFCPECAAGLSVRKVYIGQHVRCRKCNHKFMVPSLTAPIIPPSLESPSGQNRFDTLELIARLSGQNELKQAHEALHELQSAHAELQQAHASLQTKYDELEALYHELKAASLADASEARLERDRLVAEVDRLGGVLAQREAEAECDSEARAALESRLRTAEDERGELEQARAADQARIEVLVEVQSQAEKTLHDALEKEARHELEIQSLTNQLALCHETSRTQASEAEAELKSQLEQARLDRIAVDQRLALLERTNREMTTALGRMGVGPIRRRF